MKSHPFFNSVCSVLIGFAGVSAVVGTTWAADVGMPVLAKSSANALATQSQMPATAAAVSGNPNGEKSDPKGAQGPIRTESNDRMAVVSEASLHHDLEMNRYPMRNEVGIP